MTDLNDFARVAASNNNFCVIATTRADGSIQASLVSAGVLDAKVVLVANGGTRKLAHLRSRPRATVVAHAGGAWVTVEGDAELIGPDDPAPDVDNEGLRRLLRDAFVAAGGTHDDWDEYDRVMRADRRAVVKITPTRIYSNG